MPRFHFHIQENGRLIPDEEGQELVDGDEARREAVATGASIARDAFMGGSTQKVVVDVQQGGTPFFKVSIMLDVEDRRS